MNDSEPGRDVVDQVFFRWQGNVQGRRTGIAPVAYSCGEGQAWRLYEELAPLLRVDGGPDRRSLVRTVVSTGQVVLVHRVPGREPGGRATTNCHALVGDPEQLGVRASIGLVSWKWPGRRGAPLPGEGSPQVGPVRGSVLVEAGRDTEPTLEKRLQGLAPQLAAVTAAVLRAPTHRLSARMEELDDAGISNMSPALLWGLDGIFGNRFGADFTFATYDTTDEHRLRFVFVPSWKVSAAGDPLLSRIPLDADGASPAEPGDDAEQVAWELVRRYLERPGRGLPVASLIQQAPWDRLSSPQQQVGDLGALLGLWRTSTAMPSPTRWWPSAWQPTASAAEPEQWAEQGPADGMRRRFPADQPFAAAGPVDAPYGQEEAEAIAPAGAGYGPPETDAQPEEKVYLPPDQPSQSAASASAGPATAGPGSEGGAAPGRFSADDSFDFAMPRGFSLPAMLRERWRRRRKDSQEAERETLNQLWSALRRLSSSDGGSAQLRQRLGRRADGELLQLLERPELPRPARNLLLQALGDRARFRRNREARDLSSRLLAVRLYHYPDSERTNEDHDGSGAEMAGRLTVGTAAWLFAWAVAPHVRAPEQRAGLENLLRMLGNLASSTDRELLLRISVAPYGGRVPDFPPQLWQQLLRALLPEGEGAVAGAKAVPLGAAQGHDKRVGGEHDPMPLEYKVPLILGGLFIVLVVLLSLGLH